MIQTIKNGYKKTEIGVIPEDWEVKKIRDVCQLINGRGFKPYEWKSEGLPIIRIQNLNGSQEYNYYQGVYDKKIEVEDGQLLFAWSGSRGTSFGPHIWNGSKGLLNYHTWKVLINENEIVKPFFKIALKNLTKHIEDNAHGASALVHTQKWEMEGFEFAAPINHAEQTAIAETLSNTDALITSIEKLIAKKCSIKQGAMQQLLQPKEGWEIKKLGEIAEIYTGKKNNQDKIENGIYPFFVRSQTIERINSYSFDGEAILIPGEGNIGKIFHYINGKFDYHQRVYKISNFRDEYLGKYIYRYISEYFGRHAMGNSVKATVDSLRLPTFQIFEIPFPPTKEEQTRIATILSDMDAEITALEQKLEKYKKIKQGMMQELLTGKIRLV